METHPDRIDRQKAFINDRKRAWADLRGKHYMEILDASYTDMYSVRTRQISELAEFTSTTKQLWRKLTLELDRNNVRAQVVNQSRE